MKLSASVIWSLLILDVVTLSSSHLLSTQWMKGGKKSEVGGLERPLLNDHEASTGTCQESCFLTARRVTSHPSAWANLQANGTELKPVLYSEVRFSRETPSSVEDISVMGVSGVALCGTVRAGRLWM